MDDETELSSEQRRLLQTIELEGRLSIEDENDPKTPALRDLAAAGYLRALPLRTTGQCCIYVLTGLGVTAAERDKPNSRGAWEA